MKTLDFQLPRFKLLDVTMTWMKESMDRHTAQYVCTLICTSDVLHFFIKDVLYLERPLISFKELLLIQLKIKYTEGWERNSSSIEVFNELTRPVLS